MKQARIAIALLALPALACATALQTDPVPKELRDPSLQYFVESHGDEERGIDQLIAQELRSRGLAVKTGGRPGEFDVLVVYEDHWHYDMRSYLLFLRIDFRDPSTNVLQATGTSYQTSGAFRTDTDVVALIMAGMFGDR